VRCGIDTDTDSLQGYSIRGTIRFAPPFFLSVLTVIFPGGSGLAGTGMSPFWIILELRMMEVVVTTGATRHAKL